AAPDPLARAAATLSSATRVKELDYDRRIKDAQAALVDCVADSKTILASVEALWSQRGAGLEKLVMLDWNSLRVHGVSPDLTNQASRRVSDLLAAFGSA